MKRLIGLLVLWFCVTLHAANPAFTDFDTNDFLYTPSPAPGMFKLTLAINPTNVTFNIISSTNVNVTNFVSQTINAVSNFFQTVWVTNEYVTFEVVSNAFFTNAVIANGVGPWIYSLNGFGTNTTIYGLTVNNDFFVVGPGAPVFELINGDTSIGQAGFDGTNWYGSGGDLTNLFILAGANIVLTTNSNGSLTISASSTLTNATIFATNVVSGGTLAAATIGTFTGDITTAGGSYATTLKNTGTAGTYTKPTFDAQGRETSGASAVLASADFANQGTTTTVLHGNAAGNPTWAQVNLGSDVTGTLPPTALVANATGALTNNGSGTLGYYNNFTAQGNTFNGVSQLVQNDGSGNLPVISGQNLTNLTYRYTTNAITALNVPWQQALFTNIGANFTITLSAPANAFYESSILYVTNSGSTDFKVTMPNGVWGPPGSGTPPAFYCTNKMLTTILIQHYGQLMTNAIKQDYAP